MIRALLLLLLGTPAAGEVARVVAGEHASYTRLVIELPVASDWRVGRTAMGYGFATLQAEQPDYDLSRVWDRIPRTRLQSLRVDDATGALQLALACDCHVRPFSYRPNMIVLDVTDGPAPPDSGFEAPLAATLPSDADGTAPPDPMRASPLAYDWRRAMQSGSRAATEAGLPPLATGGLSLEPLRDQLLEQISRGAADGVVEMQMPGKPRPHDAAQWGELPWTQIRIGDAPGVEVRPGGRTETPVTQEVCLPAESLDLQAWGGGQAPHDLLVTARADLYGEFDEPNPDAVERAIQAHLYLGFGAEARTYASLLDLSEAPGLLPYYRSLSFLVDGGLDPETPFARMLECDGPAALWSALARDRLPLGPGVNTNAIVAAFLALPAHLRRDLGPKLAELLLARDDVEAARQVRNAIARTPETAPADVALLDARAELHAGKPETAQSFAEFAVSEDGASPESLVTLVEAHFRQGLPLPAEVPLTLRTLLRGAEGSAEGPALQRALVLALALAAEIDAAFAEAGDMVSADLWQVVVARATDDAFLTHAVLDPAAQRPDVSDETALAVANRLVDLGFGAAALSWLDPVTAEDPAEKRRTAAGAELAQGAAGRAVELLSGLQDPESQELRGRALAELGDFSGARASLLAAGATEDAIRLSTWEGDWRALPEDAPDPWASAARYADAAPDLADAGPLARGQGLLDDSAAMREAVNSLLSAVPGPSEEVSR